MIAFSIEIIDKGDKVEIHIGDRTIGIEPTGDGASFFPYWTDQHFTLAKGNEESVSDTAVFGHVTHNETDEKLAKVEYLTEDAYRYDMYAGMRGMGTLRHVSELGVDSFLHMDTDALKTVGEENGIIEESSNTFRTNVSEIEPFCESLASDKHALMDYIDRVYSEVGIREAWQMDGGLFFTPVLDRFILLCPDGYVIELAMDDPVDVFEQVRGTRILDVMHQMFE